MGSDAAKEYMFGGKELQEENNLDWYDFGARNYDAALGRWFSVDPLAEEFPWQSPYVFTNNNPINFIDPDGRAAISVNKPFDWYESKQTGDVVWFDGSEFREGYRNLGSSTNLAVSNGNEFTNYGLNNDGSFSNLNTGEFYHKGESVQTINGTRISSNLNTTESVKKFASDIAAPFFELPQYIGIPIINQVNKGLLNGETVFHQTYELNNWRIEPGRSATSVGRPTWEEGKQIINNTISVTPLGIETKLGPVIDYIVEDIMIKETITEIIEGL